MLAKAEANTMTGKKEVPFMAGSWVSKKVMKGVVLYASFDAHAQFMTNEKVKTGVDARVKMEDGSERHVRDIQDVKPENVRTYWPNRKMDKGWLYPK